MRTNNAMIITTIAARKLQSRMFHLFQLQWIFLGGVLALLPTVIPVHGFSPPYSSTHPYLSSRRRTSGISSQQSSLPPALFMSSNARRDDENTIDLTTTTTSPLQERNRGPADSSSSTPSSPSDGIQTTTPHNPNANDDDDASSVSSSSLSSFWKSISDLVQTTRRQSLLRLPPIRIEDTNVLLYDVFLIINLVVSISFWAVHKMQPFEWLGVAFNEGSLLSLCWIGAGLYTGAFLDSAVDAHYGSADAEQRGGPKGAGLLGLHTFIMAVNLRLLFALGIALLQHRAAGTVGGELLMPLEIGFGLLLMTAWRAVHSYIMPRF